MADLNISPFLNILSLSLINRRKKREAILDAVKEISTEVEIIRHLINHSQILKTEDNYIDTVIDKLRSHDFKEHFQMSRETVDLLLERMMPLYSTDYETGRRPIDTKKKILLSLWYFANTESYRQISERFNIGKSSVPIILDEFIKLINQLGLIEWPRGQEAEEALSGFSSLNQVSFPGAFAAIDEAHIEVLGPWDKRKKMVKLHRRSYFNKKLTFSIILQGICDYKLKFISVFAGLPGATNDARVFRQSKVGQTLISNPDSLLPNNSFILGSCAYPLLPCLMTPFPDTDNLSSRQKNYNHVLNSHREVIEQAFGKLFARFRRLRFLDLYRKEKCGGYVNAACSLHNFCLQNNDEIDAEPYNRTGDRDAFNNEAAPIIARDIREEICNSLPLH